MAAQKGSAVLIKLAVSGTQTTIGGLRSSSISLSEEMVDVTNKDSSNLRTILPAAGVQSITISGSGVFTDAASEVQARTNFGGAALQSMSFVIPDLGTYAGSFLCTTLEYAGEFNGEATYSMTFEGSGSISFTAA